MRGLIAMGGYWSAADEAQLAAEWVGKLALVEPGALPWLPSTMPQLTWVPFAPLIEAAGEDPYGLFRVSIWDNPSDRHRRRCSTVLHLQVGAQVLFAHGLRAPAASEVPPSRGYDLQAVRSGRFSESFKTLHLAMSHASALEAAAYVLKAQALRATAPGDGAAPQKE